MCQLFFAAQPKKMQNKADRAIIEVICFYLVRSILASCSRMRKQDKS